MSAKTPSKLLSLVLCKCPRCRKGDVFPHNALNLFKFSKTNDYCPHCGLKFEHETGFFWAAMYISYAFGTGIMLFFGILAVNINLSMAQIMGILIPIVIVLTPFLYRYSRILLLYFVSPFRHYEKKYSED